MPGPEVIETRVGIVGGGPARLMLSHVLAGAGIDDVVVDNCTHEDHSDDPLTKGAPA